MNRKKSDLRLNIDLRVDRNTFFTAFGKVAVAFIDTRLVVLDHVLDIHTEVHEPIYLFEFIRVKE